MLHSLYSVRDAIEDLYQGMQRLRENSDELVAIGSSAPASAGAAQVVAVQGANAHRGDDARDKASDQHESKGIGGVDKQCSEGMGYAPSPAQSSPRHQAYAPGKASRRHVGPLCRAPQQGGIVGNAGKGRPGVHLAGRAGNSAVSNGRQQARDKRPARTGKTRLCVHAHSAGAGACAQRSQLAGRDKGKLAGAVQAKAMPLISRHVNVGKAISRSRTQVRPPTVVATARALSSAQGMCWPVCWGVRGEKFGVGRVGLCALASCHAGFCMVSTCVYLD